MDTIFLARRFAAGALACVVLLATEATIAPGAASAADYVPGEVVVGYAPGPIASVPKDVATRMSIRTAFTAAPSVEVVRLPRGLTVAHAIAKLRDRSSQIVRVCS